ncbi:TldD/PmbA family protein [candidate division KSB3 bacterium]|uniref:TldD/PmbA family protein n=1 Tax=candidate division KSB3 bacterium TaxID=2044937 RepID=A0A9D5JVQ0_9BACT|nr:TldD/PmbA family protein [candidate division KSB3 bacterium]MBD3324787.1 TldD/PmbA family protein [candidate division KSB3 bacterium]
MFDQLQQILSRIDAEYADIRYETKHDTVIRFDGKELTQIGTNTTDGYVLRVLKHGGLASVVFTKASDAEQAARTALENAELIANRLTKPIQFAPAEVVQESFSPPLSEDPRDVSMTEKLDLVQAYNAIPLGHDQIATTTFNYAELIREKYFLNTEGTELREDLVTTRLVGLITSKDGHVTQNVRVSTGGSHGFAPVRNQEAYVEQRTKIALDLLKARPVKGGVYNVVLNPSLAGVFTHEAFGHFSEADIIETLPAMREKMRIGGKLGHDAVNIVDNATLPDQVGFYKYDDEGVKVRPVQLMRAGVLTGRLHSRRTAAEFSEPVSGHCVAEDYRYAPMVRMGTIFIEPGSHTFDALLARLDDGLYICDAKGGQTEGENFTFGAQYGYVVKQGKINELIRDINISGNLYQTLQDITAVGDDFVLSKAGGCGKGQLNIRSCHGGPHILVNQLVVGGV